MMHTAESYAAEWATLTGRSERDVYVPVALRPFRGQVGERVREGRVSGTVVAVTRSGLLEVNWDDGDETTECRESFDTYGAGR